MLTPASFRSRHIGPDDADTAAMLKVAGAASLDALIDETIPARIRLPKPLALPSGQSEQQFLRSLRGIAARNKSVRSYIGLGYYDCVTPSVVLRNVLENPGWYTPYTPYQAEIAQGRLESLLNFQTMVADLTAMEVATASLLDEATAAAEAMTLLARAQSRRIDSIVGPPQLMVAGSCFPQTIDVVRARAEPLGIDIELFDPANAEAVEFTDRVFGVLVQTPDEAGVVHDFRGLIARAKTAGVLVAVATDLLSLTLLTPPGELGADVVLGNSQRYGVPMGYGGPHAAFFATLDKHVRQAPGRIIGVSVDADGNRAYRMALQTREQHIRREKATSNICTAQALLANMAAFYAVYHGPKGLTAIAARVHAMAALLANRLLALGLGQVNSVFFDTIRVAGADAASVRSAAERKGINLRYRDDGTINIAVDEATDVEDLDAIVAVFASAVGKPQPLASSLQHRAPSLQPLASSIRPRLRGRHRS